MGIGIIPKFTFKDKNSIEFMIKKVTISFIILITFNLFSCQNKKTFSKYIISEVDYIREFEKADHNFCNSTGSNYNENDNAINSNYWRCRLSTTKYRLKTDNSKEENVKHNKYIGDLIAEISKMLSLSPELLLERANIQIEQIDHQKCLDMGFEFYTEDQVKIDEYFLCRKILIETRFTIPPFKDPTYSMYKNNNYNTSFVLNQRIDEKINQFKKSEIKYPNCIKYKIYGEDFTRCSLAYDNMNKCLLDIKKSKSYKEIKKKIICQRQSFDRFPSDMIKESKDNKEAIRKTNIRSDFYNNNDFNALGINDISQFESSKDNISKNDSIKNQNDNNLLNSNKALYADFELIKLRGQYINLCQKNANIEILEYEQQMKSKCQDIVAEFTTGDSNTKSHL
mgnify:CR=1 FL=1